MLTLYLPINIKNLILNAGKNQGRRKGHIEFDFFSAYPTFAGGGVHLINSSHDMGAFRPIDDKFSLISVLKTESLTVESVSVAESTRLLWRCFETLLLLFIAIDADVLLVSSSVISSESSSPALSFESPSTSAIRAIDR